MPTNIIEHLPVGISYQFQRIELNIRLFHDKMYSCFVFQFQHLKSTRINSSRESVIVILSKVVHNH